MCPPPSEVSCVRCEVLCYRNIDGLCFLCVLELSGLRPPRMTAETDHSSLWATAHVTTHLGAVRNPSVVNARHFT